MTKLQAIRWFADIVAGEHVVISRMRDDWGISLSDSYPRLILPSDLTKNDEGDRAFRKFFISLCPIAQGFSNPTISILHEIGHHFHRIEFLISDVDEYENASGEAHFNLPCERVATEWAIKWLQDKAHRAIAKRFEREFFGHAQARVRPAANLTNL